MAKKKPSAAVLELARREYSYITSDEHERDEDGFIKLKPTASHIDRQSDNLTSSIESLEEKLRRYRAEKNRFDDLKQTPEYKEEKSGKGKKKRKKERQNLLEMVFNNADELRSEIEEELEDDEENYRDSAKTKREKKKTNTLDTTYGKRFSPVVSFLHESIRDFDAIADEIEKELKTKTSTRGMYRSSQMSNLISAKNSKLSAVKELASVSKTISDLEYKQAKDQKGEESDSTRAITLLGAQYLRGSLDNGSGKSKKKKEKDDSDSKKGKDKKSKKDRYNDDDDEGSVETHYVSNGKSDREQADDFAKLLLGKRKDIKLDPHEYHIDMEGHYKFIVVADSDHPDDDWEFIAVDPVTEKKIKGFKEKYKDLYPKRKLCRMTFNTERMKAIDKNSNKSYTLVLK